MKFPFSSLAVLALSPQHVAAFLAMLSEAMTQIRSTNEKQARSSAIKSGCPFSKREAESITPPSDATQQYVSNQERTRSFLHLEMTNEDLMSLKFNYVCLSPTRTLR